MIVLLDTTILIDVMRGRPIPSERVAMMVRSSCVLATSAVNVAELHAGMRPGEEQKTHRLLSMLNIYPITETIAPRRRPEASLVSARTDSAVAGYAHRRDRSRTSCCSTDDNHMDFPMSELTFYELS